MVLAFLVEKRRQPLKEALALVRSKRPQVEPNVGFLAQLLEFEEACLGSKSIDLAAYEAEAGKND